MDKTEEQIQKMTTLIEQNGALIEQSNKLVGMLTPSTEIESGKALLVNAINSKGGNASSMDTLSSLAAKIAELKVIDQRTEFYELEERPLDICRYINEIGGIVKAKSVNVSLVRGYAFEKSSTLKEMDFPNALKVGDYACSQCMALESIKLDNATEIGEYVFFECTSLCNIYMPKVETINSYAFSKSGVVNLILPNLKNVVNYVFQECLELVTVDCPEAESFGARTFRGCTKLESINLPKIKSIGEYFITGTNVKSLILPELETSNGYGFRDATYLEYLELPKISIIQSALFSNDKALQVLKIPSATQFNSNSTFTGCTKLIDIHIGKMFNNNISLSKFSYNPTEAYAKNMTTLCYDTDLEEYGQTFNTNWDKWKWCIINHFAANLPDNTGGTAYTITFGSTVLGQFDDEMKLAFTNKNWNLA